MTAAGIVRRFVFFRHANRSSEKMQKRGCGTWMPGRTLVSCKGDEMRRWMSSICRGARERHLRG